MNSTLKEGKSKEIYTIDDIRGFIGTTDNEIMHVVHRDKIPYWMDDGQRHFEKISYTRIMVGLGYKFVVDSWALPAKTNKN